MVKVPRIDLSRVPVFGRQGSIVIFEELNPQALDVKIGILTYVHPLTVNGTLDFSKSDLIGNITIRGEKRFSCSRCLESFTRPFTKDVHMQVNLENKSRINLLPEIGEELRVDAPIQALCQENCKGLCSTCGLNQNQEACDCSKGE